MQTILLVIHVMLAVALVGTVLLQRSEGGALGIGGGGGLMTGRSAANLLTRATAVLAALFFLSSIALSILAGQAPSTESIIEQAPAETAPSGPSESGGPSVPLSQ